MAQYQITEPYTNDYKHTGWFYFGQTSIPFHVKDNIYQVKCLWRWTEYAKDFKTKYLEFRIDDKTTLDQLNKLQHPYMQKATGRFHYSNKHDVLYMYEIHKPKMVGQSKYQTQILNQVYNRLSKMAIQKKPK